MSDAWTKSPVCGARTRQSGTPCQRPAGEGTDHLGFGRCKLHGGASPSGRKAGAVAMARAEAVKLGASLAIDDHEALELCVSQAANMVAYCAAQVSKLTDEQALGRRTVTVRRRADEQEDGDGWLVETRELDPVLNAWILAHQDALDRLNRFAKVALDAGVAERRVRIAERQAEQIAAVFNAVVRDLEAAGLPAGLRQVLADSFRTHMGLLDAVPTTAQEIAA